MVPDCRVYFRPIEANWHDAYLVTRWRNQDDARAAFFSTDVVTPDTHMDFMAHRKPHDLVWIVERRDTGIGMASLTVDVKARIGETGRLYVDPHWRGMGYYNDIELTRLSFAFDVLNLDNLFSKSFLLNVAIINNKRKIGWQDNGIIKHERGSVLKMTYTKERWKEMINHLDDYLSNQEGI